MWLELLSVRGAHWFQGCGFFTCAEAITVSWGILGILQDCLRQLSGKRSSDLPGHVCWLLHFCHCVCQCPSKVEWPLVGVTASKQSAALHWPRGIRTWLQLQMDLGKGCLPGYHFLPTENNKQHMLKCSAIPLTHIRTDISWKTALTVLLSLNSEEQ